MCGVLIFFISLFTNSSAHVLYITTTFLKAKAYTLVYRESSQVVLPMPSVPPVRGNRKVALADASGDTLLHKLSGIGNSSISVLRSAGFELNKYSTLSDFKSQTKSLGDMTEALYKKGISASYSTRKLNRLWRETSHTKNSGLPVAPEGGDADGEGAGAISNPANNFTLAPKGVAPQGDPQDAPGNEEENPEIHALTRDPAPEKAVATGMIAANVEVSVIPDVTLPLTISDKEIANPPLVKDGIENVAPDIW